MTRERRLGTIVSELMARRGYASIGADEQLAASVGQVIGPVMMANVRVGKLGRGVLHLLTVDSTTMQELTFLKRQLLARLQADHPQAKITDVRFRIVALN